MDWQRPETDFKSQVLAATDIVELIGRSVSLKKRGKNYLGLCPFHQEKTASFNVDPVRQFFKCFGCSARGNAIDFVIQRDRIEFIDALRLLGQQAGIVMPRFGQTKENISQRQLLLEANSAAGALFEKLLSHSADAATARGYLQQRGFTAESVRKFQIGLAADAWDTLLNALSKKFTPEILSAAGLVKTREAGNGFYDTFRNRLMFPIRDETGRIIAFGGRVLPGSQEGTAKYLNSPETPLFSKSRSVFGLDLAKQKIVESRTVAVVEGYTDVVMAHQFGATNVVSILGTALTVQHVNLLRRFADRIVLLFDSDAAGDTAVNRAVELFLTQPVEIAIASMPQGIDPDEYLLEHGSEGFAKLLENASDALTYKWKQLVRDFKGSNDLTGQQNAVQQYMEVLSAARGSGPVDSMRWGSVLTRVSRLTEIPVAELNRRFRQSGKNKMPSPQPGAAAPVRPVAQTARLKSERWILAVLLAEPARWAQVQQVVHLADFTGEENRRLAELYWQHQVDEGEPVFSEFLSTLPDAQAELAMELIEEFETLNDPAAMLNEAVALLAEMRQRVEEGKHLAQLRRMDTAGPDSTSAVDETAALRSLFEKRRQPDLRRIGS